MPKRAKEEYENDGVFVEDAPKSKKYRGGAAKGDDAIAPAEFGGVQKDEDGNEYWELSRTRRIGLSKFNNNTFVNIREYYQKDKGGDQWLPGKKGISLSVDQYVALVEALPQLEKALKSKGINVPRPKYEVAEAAEKVDEPGEDRSKEEDEDGGDEMQRKSSHPEKLDKTKARANHEATSDEDEG